MEYNMQRYYLLLTAIAFSLLLAAPSWAQSAAATLSATDAQSNGNGQVLGTVQNGNTTIVFQPANNSDLDMARLQTWSEFAQGNPRIAHALAYHPSLMNNDAYLKHHPELSTFFDQHPDVREAMASDPGNFVAIPPRAGE
jgi:hypothetical protein